MNPAISQEISLFNELLGQNQEVGIIIGSHQNLDTYAASLALFASLKAAGKKVQIISKKAPTVEVSGLVGIDKVKEGFSTGSNSKLVISLPYIKGEVEKVLFTEYPNPQNPTNINFHLTAAAGKSITPFDLSEVKLMWDGGSSPSLVITVGVGSIDELQGIVDQNSSKIVNIDNYQGNTHFGDVIMVDNAFSSLSEISGKIIKDLNLPQDVDTAQNILDGVLFATKNFTKPNTSPFAFESVSSAMYAGAKRNEDRASQAQPRPSHQNQDRGRDNRGGHGQNRPQRVNENDFPAMHMQGGRTQNQQDRTIDNSQRQPFAQNQNRSFDQRHAQNRQPRPNQQFGQNQNDVDELMRKINEENAKRDQNQRFDPRPSRDFRNDQDEQDVDNRFSAQDAQIVEEPMNMHQNDNRDMPEENYNQPDPSEVPDDWLMPKVFKSSKNNN